jgi:hypothetical protein
VFRSPNRGIACGVYYVPYEDGYGYVGATNHVSVSADPLPSVEAVRGLLSAAIDQVSTSLADAELHKVMVGYRPTTLDTFPLVGRTSIDGVWLASGTKRDGLHLSPKLAEELVTAIDTGTQPFSGVFAPERSLLLEVPKRVAIDRAVTLLLAAERRRATRSPRNEADVRATVLGAYAQSGLLEHELGIPPELLEMYRAGHANANVAVLLAGASARARPR